MDLKHFKPTGRFFEDVQTLVRMFGIKTHPALREATYRHAVNHEVGSHLNESHDEHLPREIVALTFYKYRLDRASLRATFMCLPSAQHI